MKTLFGCALMALSLAASPSLADDLARIEVKHAFARATLPNAPVAGGYLTIANHGESDDRLIGAKADFAGEVQIHEMTHEGDVMHMRELPEGIALPAGGTVHLSPGGNHLMFMQLSAPLVRGNTVTVTLTFEQGGDIAVPFAVGAINARSYDGAGAHPASEGHTGHGN